MTQLHPIRDFERSLTIIDRFKHQFDAAMKYAFISEYDRAELISKEKKCFGYRIEDGGILIFDSLPKNLNGFIAFPYPFDVIQTISFCWGWIENNRPYGIEPDTDGSTAKGFQITTDGTGWQSDSWCSFLFIRPTWLIYGK